MTAILSRKPKAASHKQKPQARGKMRACGFSMRACGFSLAACGFSLAASLLTLRLAFLVGRGQRRVTDVDGARLCRVEAGDVDRPPVAGNAGRPKDVARRRAERRGTGNRRTAGRASVLERVGKVRLFRRDEVAKVGLHRSDVRLLLRVRELRNGDGGKNADDDDHDQKLDQRETLAIHLDIPLVLVSWLPMKLGREDRKQALCPARPNFIGSQDTNTRGMSR